MQIEMVVLISLTIALAVLGLATVITKMVMPRKAKVRKLPFRVGELPLSDSEKDDPVTTIRNAEKAMWPVYWFDDPSDRRHPSCGFLERIRGRRAIIRLASGKRIRRKAYLVYLVGYNSLLAEPPMPEPKPISRKLEVSSEADEADEVTAKLVELERHFESSAA